MRHAISFDLFHSGLMNSNTMGREYTLPLFGHMLFMRYVFFFYFAAPRKIVFSH